MEPKKRKASFRRPRPESWRTIAELYEDLGPKNLQSVISAFPEELEGRTSDSIKQALNIWIKDMKDESFGTKSAFRTPIYGAKVDKELRANVDQMILSGVQVDPDTLRFNLLGLLGKHDLQGLLVENGGTHTFRKSWAQHFWKRHNLPSRAVTTKQRIIPGDFAITLTLEPNSLLNTTSRRRNSNTD